MKTLICYKGRTGLQILEQLQRNL